MDMINGTLTTSISEFKKNPNAEVKKAKGKPFAVLTNNKPSFYVVPSQDFEEYLDYLFDKHIEEVAAQRIRNNEKLIKVDLKDLL